MAKQEYYVAMNQWEEDTSGGSYAMFTGEAIEKNLIDNYQFVPTNKNKTCDWNYIYLVVKDSTEYNTLINIVTSHPDYWCIVEIDDEDKNNLNKYPYTFASTQDGDCPEVYQFEEESYQDLYNLGKFCSIRKLTINELNNLNKYIKWIFS